VKSCCVEFGFGCLCGGDGKRRVDDVKWTDVVLLAVDCGGVVLRRWSV
jgi:hypothetical protein